MARAPKIILLKFYRMASKRLLLNTILITFLLCIYSCQDNTSKVFIVFDQLKKKVNADELITFKELEIDSVGENLKGSFFDLNFFYKDSIQYIVLDKYLDSLNISSMNDIRELYLQFAFRSFLNSEDIDTSVLNTQVRRVIYLRKENWEKLSERYEIENLNIAKTNFKKYNVGDTVRVVLPIKTSFGSRSIYYTQGFPYSQKYDSAEDSLGIEGVLLMKRYEKLPNTKVDSSSFVFELRIIDLSEMEVEELLGNKLKVGDSFNFYLSKYGRYLD